MKRILSNTIGRLVAEIKNQNLKACQEALSFGADNWATGVYFYHAIIGSQSFTSRSVKQQIYEKSVWMY